MAERSSVALVSPAPHPERVLSSPASPESEEEEEKEKENGKTKEDKKGGAGGFSLEVSSVDTAAERVFADGGRGALQGRSFSFSCVGMPAVFGLPCMASESPPFGPPFTPVDRSSFFPSFPWPAHSVHDSCFRLSEGNGAEAHFLRPLLRLWCGVGSAEEGGGDGGVALCSGYRVTSRIGMERERVSVSDDGGASFSIREKLCRKEDTHGGQASRLPSHPSAGRPALASERRLSLWGVECIRSSIPVIIALGSSFHPLSALQEKEQEELGNKEKESGGHKESVLLEHLEHTTNPQCRQ